MGILHLFQIRVSHAISAINMSGILKGLQLQIQCRRSG